jgi:hypothetical protein
VDSALPLVRTTAGIVTLAGYRSAFRRAQFHRPGGLGRQSSAALLHYRGKRRTTPGIKGVYKEMLSVTLDNQSGEWVVTKYDAIY